VTGVDVSDLATMIQMEIADDSDDPEPIRKEIAEWLLTGGLDDQEYTIQQLAEAFCSRHGDIL